MANNHAEKKNTNDKLNYINLSSFLKKNDKPLEFKVLSQNSSRSHIKLDSEQNKIKNENNKEKIIKNQQENKNDLDFESFGNSDKNKKNTKNLLKNSEENVIENLFTFHKIENNDNYEDLCLNDILNFKQSLLKFRKNNMNNQMEKSTDIYKELTNIRDLINEILK